jgi:hypothetical protein
MKLLLYTFSILYFPLSSYAQIDSVRQTQFFKRDSIKRNNLNMDGIYNRPFLNVSKLPLAIGGYIETNASFEQIDGVNNGLDFQFRRMTLFFSSTIGKQIKFISEMEFEDGTKEINIESAVMDVEIHPLLVLRSGIILNPIGAFNQNHDGPRWDFIDRPTSSTSIIPSTLSNVGMGFYGKKFYGQNIVGYEVYLTNGFNEQIISNEENRTSLANGKNDIDKFEKSFSGNSTLSSKIALKNRKIGELGISYLHGIYNKWKQDGAILDKKRAVDILALDFNTSLYKNKINIQAEFCKVMVDVPKTYIQTYGGKQAGAFVDVVYTLCTKKIAQWEKAKLNIGVRFDYADYNLEKFVETNKRIVDDVFAIVPSIALRPTGSSVLRLNARFQTTKDMLGNPPSQAVKYMFGISTYF